MHLPMGSYEPRSDAGITGVPRLLVFVVEDEEDIARLISHNLQAAGFEVQSFFSGASVLSEALREMPSLFLLDVMLPGADGFELCRQIRQTTTLSAAPIIIPDRQNSGSGPRQGTRTGRGRLHHKAFQPARVGRTGSQCAPRRTPTGGEIGRASCR